MHANAVTRALFSTWPRSSMIRKFEGHLAFVIISTHDHQADFPAPLLQKIVSDARHCLSCGVRQAVQQCQSFIWDLPSPYEVNPFWGVFLGTPQPIWDQPFLGRPTQGALIVDDRCPGFAAPMS